MVARDIACHRKKSRNIASQCHIAISSPQLHSTVLCAPSVGRRNGCQNTKAAQKVNDPYADTTSAAWLRACRCCRNVCRRVGGANRRDPCAAQLRPYEGNELKRSCKWCVLAQVQVHRVAGQRAAARAIATYRAASPKIAPVYPSITSLAQGFKVTVSPQNLCNIS